MLSSSVALRRTTARPSVNLTVPSLPLKRSTGDGWTDVLRAATLSLARHASRTAAVRLAIARSPGPEKTCAAVPVPSDIVRVLNR
eukprot:6190116-Pleurochrysis_carterae.AAC.2